MLAMNDLRCSTCKAVSASTYDVAGPGKPELSIFQQDLDPVRIVEMFVDQIIVGVEPSNRPWRVYSGMNTRRSIPGFLSKFADDKFLTASKGHNADSARVGKGGQCPKLGSFARWDSL